MSVYNEICVSIVLSTGQLALYSTVHCHIVYYRDRVYGHDKDYEAENLSSRVALRLGD